MTIYIAILKDRHQEDVHLAFKNIEAAKKQCKTWMGAPGYKKYEWKERPFPESSGWSCYHETFDDGPTVLVETIELK